MRFKLGLIFIVVLCMTGCSKKHYYTVNDQSLSLYYQNADAKEVLFASSIDRFALHPTKKADNNMWKISVVAQEEFAYFYIVDGRSILPDCPVKELDDFGSENCLYVKSL